MSVPGENGWEVFHMKQAFSIVDEIGKIRAKLDNRSIDYPKIQNLFCF